MNILVTGGAGAIGSYLCRSLIDRGDHVTVIDDMSSGFEFNIHKDVVFFKGDIADMDVLREVFESNQFDVVYHLAAFFANQNSVDHPLRDLEVNGKGTLNVLELCKEYHQKGVLKHLIYASSSCVYGMCEGSIDEDQPFNPETPYAISKILGERYVDFYYEFHKLPATSFRFFNSYGPGELPGKYRNVIPNFIRKALYDEEITITGTGEETRDFTFIGDTVQALILAAGNEKVFGQKLNIATGKETMIIDLARKIIEYSGSSSQITYKPRRSWDHTTSRLGSARKLKELVGFEPSRSLDEGLKETIAWHKDLKEQGVI